ncbi:MAG: TfoX/Sxy family protein [Patescibacteria group bacterium UBA2103]
MSASEEFTQYILDLLSPLGNIEVKRMFGGALLKVSGKQLGVIINDQLYFKVLNSEVQKRYESEGSTQFSYTRKDKKEPIIIKNWWSVPEEIIERREDLIALAEESLRYQD